MNGEEEGPEDVAEAGDEREGDTGDGEMKDKDEAAEEQSKEPEDSAETGAGRGGPSEVAAGGDVEMDSGASAVRRCGTARLRGVPRRSTKLLGPSLEYSLEGEEKDSEKVRVTEEPGKGKGLRATDTIEKDETVAVVIGVPVVVEKADHPLRGMSDHLKAKLQKVFPHGAYVWVGRSGEDKGDLVFFVHYDSPDKRFRDLSTYANVASGKEKGNVYI
uniref:Uncharacterized protein n=1 Tax=Chromera velia CCMP2878 TaxID=1169474 RepID=A0A0G4HUB1_9ALVE|eukprot:Cvel_1376.t1-p1 / transcript=Cvel_1376.t1 / gene=Cvel_1376 / organism=Chromera_velia_CCMP2878 / gene_product=hypothetical protein / transcript_product=hypothetical protein / location=Cvel_scaffold47:136658-139640(+) / protein_length=216 / sequence_SO=supercontig / SO=protein_coding / is_pseudo=false